MSMTLGNLTIIRPETMLDWIVKRINGQFVGNYFIPNKAVADTVYKWHYYGIIGGMTPEVGENEIGPLISTEYEQRTGRVKFYRERTQVSDYTNLIELFNVGQENSETLADRLSLRIEQSKIGAIVQNANRTTEAKGYFWKDCSDDGSHIIGGTGNVSIIDTFIDAKQSISEYAKMQPDTVLIGTRLAAAIQKAVEFNQWDRRGPMAQQMPQTGKLEGLEMPTNPMEQVNIGRLAGLEIFVSNASILSDLSNPRSPLIPLVENDMYIFRRGQDLGACNVFIGINVENERQKFARMTEYQIETAFRCNVKRPQLIYTVANAIAP